MIDTAQDLAHPDTGATPRADGWPIYGEDLPTETLFATRILDVLGEPDDRAVEEIATIIRPLVAAWDAERRRADTMTLHVDRAVYVANALWDFAEKEMSPEACWLGLHRIFLQDAHHEVERLKGELAEAEAARVKQAQVNLDLAADVIRWREIADQLAAELQATTTTKGYAQ